MEVEQTNESEAKPREEKKRVGVVLKTANKIGERSKFNKKAVDKRKDKLTHFRILKTKQKKKKVVEEADDGSNEEN